MVLLWQSQPVNRQRLLQQFNAKCTDGNKIICDVTPGVQLWSICVQIIEKFTKLLACLAIIFPNVQQRQLQKVSKLKKDSKNFITLGT